jgi:hypothetical protein
LQPSFIPEPIVGLNCDRCRYDAFFLKSTYREKHVNLLIMDPKIKYKNKKIATLKGFVISHIGRPSSS